jgi:hypothetical protein
MFYETNIIQNRKMDSFDDNAVFRGDERVVQRDL